jgi:hypothetical protein
MQGKIIITSKNHKIYSSYIGVRANVSLKRIFKLKGKRIVMNKNVPCHDDYFVFIKFKIDVKKYDSILLWIFAPPFYN